MLALIAAARLGLLLAALAPAPGHGQKRKKSPPAPPAPTIAPNWQTGWSEGIKDCKVKKKPLFTRKGKPIGRKLYEMPTLLANLMADQEDQKEAMAAKNRPKKKETRPMTKREKKKKAELADILGAAMTEQTSHTQKATEVSKKRKIAEYEKYVHQFISQAMNRAHFTPDTELQLSEFCDLMWRAGNVSPMDPTDEEEDAWERFDAKRKGKKPPEPRRREPGRAQEVEDDEGEEEEGSAKRLKVTR